MQVSIGLFCSFAGLCVGLFSYYCVLLVYQCQRVSFAPSVCRSLLTLVDAYLRFSQEQLAPFVEANPGYLVDLERAYRVLSVDHQTPKAHLGIYM
jgi:hypothetical protein